MRIFFLSVFLLGFFVSCGNKKNTSVSNENSSDSTRVFRSDYDTERLTGHYLGSFGNSTLILHISYINGQNVSGYDIVKGNRRNLKGSLKDKGASFEFSLSEPGTDKFDGIFNFEIDTADFKLHGTWEPLTAGIVKNKTFVLERRALDSEPEDLSGTWYLDGIRLDLKTDGTGVAKGTYDAGNEDYKETEFRFTWMEVKGRLKFEWQKNPIFKQPVMSFAPESENDTEAFVSGDYHLYRYW